MAVRLNLFSNTDKEGIYGGGIAAVYAEMHL